MQGWGHRYSLWRMIQLQSSLGEGLMPLQQLHCGSAVGSAFLRAWDLATKRQITLIFPGFRFSKYITISGELFRESPSCFWALEKLFWCLPPHYANPNFRSSLLNTRNSRWKSLGHGIWNHTGSNLNYLLAVWLWTIYSSWVSSSYKWIYTCSFPSTPVFL